MIKYFIAMQKKAFSDSRSREEIIRAIQEAKTSGKKQITIMKCGDQSFCMSIEKAERKLREIPEGSCWEPEVYSWGECFKNSFSGIFGRIFG